MIFGFYASPLIPTEDEPDDDYGSNLRDVDDICYMEDGTNKWMMYPLTLPLKERCNVFFGFGSIVFVIYSVREQQHGNIWCLNLIEDKWYKSDKCMLPFFDPHLCENVKTDDNFVHFIGGHSNSAKIHVRVSLLEMIPNELLKFGIYYQKLVNGYWRVIQDVNNDDMIPIDMTDIISQYLNEFC